MVRLKPDATRSTPNVLLVPSPVLLGWLQNMRQVRNPTTGV